MNDTELLDKLQELVENFDPGEGGMGFTVTPKGEILFSAEWGREASDSPMAGAAAYGVGDDIRSCIESIK